MPDIWTIEKCKDVLPLVRVKVGDKVFTGRTKGRHLNHPTIVVDCGCVWCKAGHYHTIETSWNTLATVLNSVDGTLKV